jgi:hypothetical protein
MSENLSIPNFFHLSAEKDTTDYRVLVLVYITHFGFYNQAQEDRSNPGVLSPRSVDLFCAARVHFCINGWLKNLPDIVVLTY